MKDVGTPNRLQDVVFLALVIIVSIAFLWVIGPFAGAIIWSIVAAILFVPLNDDLLRLMPGRRNIAALLTLLVIFAIIIVPALFLGAALIQEATGVYFRVQSGEIDPVKVFNSFYAGLPSMVRQQIDNWGLTDLQAMQARFGSSLATGFRAVAAQALTIGQSTLGFFVGLSLMLYLTFFLLRDGNDLSARIEHATPLRPAHRRALFQQFVTVVRATIKGSVVVAVLQGVIGGVAFWMLGIGGALLWGVSMGILSLLPAVGTAVIWAPVSIYLLVTGSVWQGVVLALSGFFIISSIDNVVRPILVGRDTRMPDYVVLISTFGGLSVLGFAGLVIGPVVAALFIAVWDIFAKAQETGWQASDVERGPLGDG